MGDLTVTALYTSQVWMWGGLSQAHLLATPDAKRVFDITNAALGIARKPPLRYALLHRHAMIDHLLREAGAPRVLELAAGLSRRGAAFCGELAYCEVDLPSVIAKKRELLARSEDGRRVLERLQLEAGDVTTIDLAPLAGDGRVFVIAEGLMMYLAGDARRALFAKVRGLAERASDIRFVFDLTPTDELQKPGFAGRVLEAAMKRFTGGRTFERDARSRAQILDELRAAGWPACEAIAANDVARAWNLPHADRETATVLFSARAPATRS
jgi:O-methyltransferase involved in polyketide biosynthesis